MNKIITPLSIQQKKNNQEKIVMLTAYDFLLSELLDELKVDIVLIGDSLGNVFNGFQTTIPVTLEQIIYHSQAVSRGNSTSLLVADMPFLSYHVSLEQTIANAGKLLKEGLVHAVKLEISHEKQIKIVETLVDLGIPVMAHLGFTPQTIYQLGGYKIQGKNQTGSVKLLALAKALEASGAFALVLEMIPQELAKKITLNLKIPTIGIGAGRACDGQVLVTQDLLGMNPNSSPKFVKKYADLNSIMTSAITSFIREVKTNQYPAEEYSY